MTSRADTLAVLTAANARRRRATLSAARQAIEQLIRDRRPVTFGAVAHAAGISRAWLYREPELRAVIEQLRHVHDEVGLAGRPHRASADSLRQRLDTARGEISRLRAENAALRDQLARHLGAQRARPARPA